MNRENAWTTYEEADIKALEGLCKEYKDFLSNGKTERECVAQSIELAKKAGYQDLEELIKNQTPLKAGNKVYRTWMEKTIALFQIGEDAIEDGLNILGAHIDSPRLDLKQNPLYEDTEMALLDTHYYGGVKKYQWVTLPMALHGVVVKKDGTKVNICIGEKVFLSVGGILLAVMLLTENTSTYDEAKLTYVNHHIIPNLEISTLVDNTRNSLEIKESTSVDESNNQENATTSNEMNSIKVDSKKQETNSNNKIEKKETTVSELKPSSKEKSISKQEDTYSKQVTIYRSNGNVVSMDLEEYLIGVVGAEMPASFQMEALKAQAVVARTYALKLLASGKKLTDTVSTQVYKDNNELKKLWGNSYSTYYQKIKEAVTSTKGVSVYYQGNYINALYHSTSNGKTEDASMVWGNSVPYLKSVDSKWDIQASSYLREIKEDFTNILNLLGVSSDTNIQFEVISRDESGRVEKIKVGDKIFDGVTFRNLLKLRSTDFSIMVINNQVSITTKGYGHGVGLSQYGANGMAQEGYTYKEILKHYYTGVEVY